MCSQNVDTVQQQQHFLYPPLPTKFTEKSMSTVWLTNKIGCFYVNVEIIEKKKTLKTKKNKFS